MPRAATIFLLLYFFLILSTLGAGSPKPRTFTLGVNTDISIDDVDYDTICKCIRNACKNWEKTGLVKFIYKKNPQIIVTSQENYKEDVIGHYYKGRITIISKIYPDLCYKKWDEELLTRILTHEIGHYFGLKHSKNIDSIMYYRPLVNKPSIEDFDKLKENLGKRDVEL